MTDRPDHLGHRRRLRERFLKGGGDALPDYELLEMVLFMAQPRGDTKPQAKALLKRFRSFAEVVSAEPKALAETEGVGEAAVAAIKVVQAAAERLMRDQVLERPVLSSWQKLLDYCKVAMGRNATEQFRVLYLNRKNVLIADELQQKGTVDHTPVYPREIIKRALDLGASAIIMVHNHPSGDPTPSAQDIERTREVREAGERLGVALHDHVVVSRRGTVSFRGQGHL